jgi:hypothetical protein
MSFYISDEVRAKELLDNFGAGDHSIQLENLLKTKGFVVEDDTNWEDRSQNKYNLSYSDLSQHIGSEHPAWSESSIENDVDAVNRINRLRRGNYSVCYGGKQKLPVLVTSNSFLIKSISTYSRGNSNIVGHSYCLPVISDSVLTYSLWIKNERNGLNIENAVMAKMVYAINHANAAYKKEFIDKIVQLQKSDPDMLPFKIETAQASTINDTIAAAIRATNGNTQELTTEIIVASEKEAIENRTYEQRKEIDALSTENEKIKNKYDATQEALNKRNEEFNAFKIESAVEKQRYRMNWLLKTVCGLLKFLGIGIFIAATAITVIIGYILSNIALAIALEVIMTIATSLVFTRENIKERVDKQICKLKRDSIEKHIAVTNVILGNSENCEIIMRKIVEVANAEYLQATMEDNPND